MGTSSQAPMGKLGRYQLISELGRGGMGVVYQAIDPLLERTVALKTLYLIDDTDERRMYSERLMREAHAAAILSHPGIVTIYQIDEDNGIPYIAMEYVQGPSLASLLKKVPIPKRIHVHNILRQVADALDYAHGKGVIHRDIKPDNIMIQQGGMVKITDFGIAKAAASSRTRTGMHLGTPFYMAPEQILGKTVDGRTDQYALGVVAYQMLTGGCPFSADSLPTLIYQILQEDLQPDNQRLAALGPIVDVALRKALAKQPDSRFQTCAEFVHALALGSS